MRKLNKLNAAFAKTAPKGKYGDGGGLWLHKRDATSGKWMFLFKLRKRRREMGLGGFPEVSLKDARDAAQHCRTVTRDGRDPIKARERDRRELERNMHLLKDIAHDAFETRKAELRGAERPGAGSHLWNFTYCPG
jgi:hypothetical protein